MALVTTARAAIVYLERGGRVVEHDGEEIAIPKFRGNDRVWASVLGCVTERFAPFRVDIVDREPVGEHITVVVGGRSSQLGLDDRNTAGVSPYIPGTLQPDATVHVFSEVVGERNAVGLCETAAHEIGHALGLDHSYRCGDIMSYFGDRCGTQRFLDVAAPCGEDDARECGTGQSVQNSYGCGSFASRSTGGVSIT
jgi:hypothetical protein